MSCCPEPVCCGPGTAIPMELLTPRSTLMQSVTFTVGANPLVLRGYDFDGNTVQVEMVDGPGPGMLFGDYYENGQPVRLSQRTPVVVLRVPGRYRLVLCGCIGVTTVVGTEICGADVSMFVNGGVPMACCDEPAPCDSAGKNFIDPKFYGAVGGSAQLGPGITGTTAAAGDCSTALATTQFVCSALAGPLTLTNPIVNGVVAGVAQLGAGITALTAAAGTCTTAIATTQFVCQAIAALADETDPLPVITSINAPRSWHEVIYDDGVYPPTLGFWNPTAAPPAYNFLTRWVQNGVRFVPTPGTPPTLADFPVGHLPFLYDDLLGKMYFRQGSGIEYFYTQSGQRKQYGRYQLLATTLVMSNLAVGGVTTVSSVAGLVGGVATSAPLGGGNVSMAIPPGRWLFILNVSGTGTPSTTAVPSWLNVQYDFGASTGNNLSRFNLGAALLSQSWGDSLSDVIESAAGANLSFTFKVAESALSAGGISDINTTLTLVRLAD